MVGHLSAGIGSPEGPEDHSDPGARVDLGVEDHAHALWSSAGLRSTGLAAGSKTAAGRMPCPADRRGSGRGRDGAGSWGLRSGTLVLWNNVAGLSPEIHGGPFAEMEARDLGRVGRGVRFRAQPPGPARPQAQDALDQVVGERLAERELQIALDPGRRRGRGRGQRRPGPAGRG